MHQTRKTIDEFVREYAEIQRIERTPKTARRSETELRKLAHLIVDPTPDTLAARKRTPLPRLVYMDEITRLTLAQWREAHPHARGTTLRGYHSAIKAALNYAVSAGYIARNPCLQMPMTFSRKKLAIKRALQREEFTRLMRQLEREARESWEAHRLYALTATIFFSGMRTAEGQRLRTSEIDTQTGLIDLRNRRLKTEASSRLVAMTDQLRHILADWIPLAESEWAFPHAYRTGPWTGGAPGKKPVQRLQQAAKRAGVDHVTFAMGRHTFATLAKTQGMTAELIAGQLGHTNERTQEHYTHLDGRAIRGVVAMLKLADFDPGREAQEPPERTSQIGPRSQAQTQAIAAG